MSTPVPIDVLYERLVHMRDHNGIDPLRFVASALADRQITTSQATELHRRLVAHEQDRSLLRVRPLRRCGVTGTAR